MRHGQHQANPVLLIDLCGGEIIVNGHNVDSGMNLGQAPDHALAVDVIGETAKRLGTDDVLIAVFRQFQHFCRQQPSFAHL